MDGRDVVTLKVYGTPAPQGSKTAVGGHGGRPRMVEGRRPKARAAFKAWRAQVAEQGAKALADRGGVVVGGDQGAHGTPLYVSIAFTVPKPASKPKYLRWSRVRPDVDKLARAVLDALDTDCGLIADDSRVAAMVVTKQYAAAGTATGANITIATLGEDDVLATTVRPRVGDDG